MAASVRPSVTSRCSVKMTKRRSTHNACNSGSLKPNLSDLGPGVTQRGLQICTENSSAKWASEKPCNAKFECCTISCYMKMFGPALFVYRAISHVATLASEAAIGTDRDPHSFCRSVCMSVRQVAQLNARFGRPYCPQSHKYNHAVI